MHNRKEEILARSRKSNEDEGIEFAMNDARKMTRYAHLLVDAFLWIIILLAGIKKHFSLVLAILILEGTRMTFCNLARYRFTKEKSGIVGTVVFGIFTLICAIIFAKTMLSKRFIRRETE